MIGTPRALDVFKSPRAASMLGADHPLARTAELAHAVARQAGTTSIPLAVAVLGVFGDRSWGWPLLVAAWVVELTLLGILACVRQVQREHVLRLIASGRTWVPLDEVSREVLRLAGPRHARRLATRLERTLDDAVHWGEIALACRPLPATRALCLFAPEVDAILAQLRERPGLPGLASLELFLIGGHDSALYSGDEDALRQQLWQIRRLLAQSSHERESEDGS
jgi:hypothetical protein